MQMTISSPSWVGAILLASGTVVLLSAPKIVAFLFLVAVKLNDWYLNFVAKVGGIRYVLDSRSFLWKGVRFSCWSSTVLVGFLLVITGVIILLKVPFRI